MPTTGSWHRLTVWTRNRLSSVSRNQTHTLPATNYWEQSVFKWKMAVSLITCTVPTGPKRTPNADAGFASSPLLKNLGPRRVRSESARGPLRVSLMREADLALLLPPTSPAPCIFLIHCPVGSLCTWSSHRKIHTCRTVKRFHGEHQFNSIYLLIRQTCWHTTMLHKMKS